MRESNHVLARRTLLFGGLGVLAACTRPKAQGFAGYAFIANQECTPGDHVIRFSHSSVLRAYRVKQFHICQHEA